MFLADIIAHYVRHDALAARLCKRIPKDVLAPDHCLQPRLAVALRAAPVALQQNCQQGPVGGCKAGREGRIV
jgi:hypothetical protein